MNTVELGDITLINSDCLDVMRGMPENSVDTCITDPPYELGFMGKKWDSSGISFQPDTWREVYRVLKPGAMLLAFGGTRTVHRIACAIEDAGFEIRDMIAWVYGCLSEDTEILTINGWERYHKNILYNPVLCYNIEDDSFIFAKPTEKFFYENKYTAYRIQSDYTDQIVSRNHRCIVKRGGRKTFEYAETLECEESVPVLESLRDLPENIPNVHEGTSVKKQDLLKRVQRQGYLNRKQRERNANVREEDDQSYLRYMWKRILQADVLPEKVRKELLFKTLQWNSTVAGIKGSRTQGASELDREVQEGTCRADDWGDKSSMEGWSNLFQKAWKLCANKICSLSERIFGHGKKRRLYYGASLNYGSGIGALFEAIRSSSSHQPQSAGQSDRKSDVISEQQETQVVRSTRATVTPINYHGNVWCVTVPTGAFVARRNGKIFITGNSGFPKSHNISKAIDKRAGAEREVVGQRIRIGDKKPYINNNKEALFNPGEFNITAPSTPEARLWDGWGTALKPAMELIVVAMKPIEGTFAENAIKWGCAGLDIDGARVGTNGNEINTRINKGNKKDKSRNSQVPPTENGKGWSGNTGCFLANLIHDGSDEVVGLFPNTKSGARKGTGNPKYGGNSYNESATLDMTMCEASSGSAARFFYCAKSSRRERNAGLEGMETSRVGMNFGGELSGHGKPINIKPHTNSHPTVKPIALMRYLCQLTKTPTGGVVLDPFMGSGTTGIACERLGRKFIGIDNDEAYFDIAVKRVQREQQQMKLF